MREILKALTVLENDIVYGTTPLPEALMNLLNKISQPINNYIEAIAKRLDKGDVESVYQGAVEEFKLLENRFYLHADDKKIMADFFRSLGSSGIYGQEKIFFLAIEGVRMNLRDAEENSKKNIKLYRYLGICLGAMIIIFII